MPSRTQEAKALTVADIVQSESSQLNLECSDFRGACPSRVTAIRAVSGRMRCSEAVWMLALTLLSL